MTSLRTWSTLRLLAAKKLWEARLRRAQGAVDKIVAVRTSIRPVTKLTPQRKRDLLEKWRDRVLTCERMIGAYSDELARRSPARVDEWLYGNVVPIKKVPRRYRPTYRRMLYAAADAFRSIGRKGEVSSSFRTKAEQQAAWDRYQNGTGPIAAPVGSSKHERGEALDLPDQAGIPGLRDDPEARKALEARGFKFDVSSEGWHASFYG